MPKFGLVGFPLGHSFSQKYFTEKFQKEGLTDYQYINFPIEDISQVIEIIRLNPDLSGLNVTIPYKEKIIPFLNEIDKEALEIGAVNTISVRNLSGQLFLKGYNTDHYGFYQSLKSSLREYHSSALILGTGGASKAVCHVFKTLGISYKFVSRKPASNIILSYSELTQEIIHDYKIIVNTSPLGMYPDVDAFPDIPYQMIGSKHILYDLIYNPLKTVFLQKGEKMGASIINGVSMLHFQAEKAWEIWNK